MKFVTSQEMGLVGSIYLASLSPQKERDVDNNVVHLFISVITYILICV